MARSTSLLIRSLAFNALFYANLTIHMVVALPAFFLPSRVLLAFIRSYARTSLWLLRVVCGINVEWRGRVDEQELVHLMQRARAFVHVAEEDFGIALVEAQAAGTPVIAYAGGAAAEIVRGLDSATPTGVLFATQTRDALVAATHCFEAQAARISAEACRGNAARFAAAHFRQALRAFVVRVTSSPR